MANTKSALKRVRQTLKRTARNKSVLSKVRTLRKKVAAVAQQGDEAAAQAAYAEFSSAVDKAAKKNIVPRNTAANYKSKAAKTIKAALA